MENEYKEVLSEVFSDVLMKYAFMFGETCQKDDLPENGDGYLHAYVSFYGYKSGVLGVITQKSLCFEMAANVLGIDPEEENSNDEAEDTLEELINIVCGQFLTATFGVDPIFNLFPPSVDELDEDDWRKYVSDNNTIGFVIEDTPAIIYVQVK